MADTYTYSGGANTYMYYKGKKMRLDDFSVVADMPVETILPVGSSLGDAGSAGIVSYSGSFNARLVVKGKSTAGHTNMLLSSNSFTPTSAVFKCSSNVAYKGKILVSNLSIDAAGGAVVKFSGSWNGCGNFDYATAT
jgi:hypothetical protein